MGIAALARAAFRLRRRLTFVFFLFFRETLRDLAQLELLDLAAWCVRYRIDEFEPFWQVLFRHLLFFQKGDHVLEA